MSGTASDLSGTLRHPSGSAGVWSKINDSRLNVEYAIVDSTTKAHGGNSAYASCTQAAAAAMAAVVDMNISGKVDGFYPTGSPGYMEVYLREHSEYWERVYPTSLDDLEPGDVLNVIWDGYYGSGIAAPDTAHPGHTAIYVGNELVQAKYPGSKGNVYQAGYSTGKYPTIDYLSFNDLKSFHVYRPIAKNESPQFPAIDWVAVAEKAGSQNYS